MNNNNISILPFWKTMLAFRVFVVCLVGCSIEHENKVTEIKHRTRSCLPRETNLLLGNRTRHKKSTLRCRHNHTLLQRLEWKSMQTGQEHSGIADPSTPPSLTLFSSHSPAFQELYFWGHIFDCRPRISWKNLFLVTTCKPRLFRTSNINSTWLHSI